MSAELHLLVADRGLISAGKVAILGLDGIKERLGQKWEKLSGLVRAFFEAAIRRSLKPGDVFFEVSGLAYVVVYRDLSVEETRLRCAALAQEVCAHLFGQEGMDVSIRSLVGDVNRGTLQNYKDLESAIETTLERFGKESIISLADCKREAAPSDDQPVFEVSFSQRPQTRLRCSPGDISFTYRPIWDCATNVILTYLCQPVPPGNLGEVLAHTGGLCTVVSGDDDCALLDRTILSHCVGYVSELHRSGSRLLLAVPVHFTTLARARAWAQFNSVFRAVSRDALRDIVFVVFGLEGVPNIRLAQELPKLVGARCIFCVIQRDGAAAVRGAGVGVQALGLELPKALRSEAEVIAQVKSVSADARQNEYESFVLGVGTTSCALNAMGAGVRYLEGPAIHPTVPDPRHVFVHEIEDLYRRHAANG